LTDATQKTRIQELLTRATPEIGDIHAMGQRKVKDLGILGERQLRQVSLTARGMYAELVYLISGNDMGSESFGRMQLEPGWISRHVGVSEQDAQRLLSELQEAMLIRVARAGGGYEIEVPALIRARDLSVKRAAAGRRGGNPALRKVVTYSAELGA
jgi:hypothetical protein